MLTVTELAHPHGWADWPELTGHPASAGEQPQLRPTRSDGSPCTAGVAQHLHDWPEPTGHPASAGKQPQLRPTCSDGSPCTAGVTQHTCSHPPGGAMHITHAAPHLPRGVDPAIQGQCTLTTGDRRACKGRQ